MSEKFENIKDDVQEWFDNEYNRNVAIGVMIGGIIWISGIVTGWNYGRIAGIAEGAQAEYDAIVQIGNEIFNGVPRV